MIYLIFDTKTKLTKIGKSENPKERLSILKTGNQNLKLIYYSDKYIEEELHKKYSMLRTSGEWFKLKIEHFKSIMGEAKGIPKTLFYRSTIKRLSANTIVDTNIKQIEIYTFAHAPKIYANTQGQFFRVSDDRPIKTIYHAGRIAVRDNNKIYGIKRLRTAAVKTIKIINDCPF